MKILLSKRPMWGAVIAASLSAATAVSAADKKYDFGASDTEIKLGQTVPHSARARFTGWRAGSAKPISRC
jgi:hypothetical protein